MAKISNISQDSTSRNECLAFDSAIRLAMTVAAPASGPASVSKTTKATKAISIKTITFR